MTTLKAPVTSRDHILGSPNALVTLVEYGDYQCSHCAAAHPVTKRLLIHFGENLRFVFRHFPLSEIHPVALPAAEAAELAGAHGRFWAMHDGIYEIQPALSLPALAALAMGLGISEAEVERAMAEEPYRDRIQEDFLGGVRSGVNGTPCFFINGVRHDGGYKFDELALAIETAPSPAAGTLHEDGRRAQAGR